MQAFYYEYPVKTYFGEGCVEQNLAKIVRNYGKNVMLSYGQGSIQKNGIYGKIRSILENEGKNVVDFSGIMPNPTYAKVQEGAGCAREHDIDLIIAAGGGSVIDCSKVIAAQSVIEQDIWEMEFTDHILPDKWIPMIAIVTASGTGSEMNNGGVITHEEKKIKQGVKGAYADYALMDPAYTLSVPMDQVISGAFDTLSHCMETYFGRPEEINVSDEIGEGVMRNLIRNMRLLKQDPENLTARSELMWDSAMGENGILKIGKVTDFQGHMIEHQLGAYTDCNHGQGLAVIHPPLYRHLYKSNVKRFARFAHMVWEIPSEGRTEEELAAAGVEALAEFIKEAALPTTLTELGITDEDVLRRVAETSRITPGCCRQMEAKEIFEILMECR